MVLTLTKIYDSKGNLQKSPPLRVTSLHLDRNLPPHPDSHSDRYFSAEAEDTKRYYMYRAEGDLVLQDGYNSIKYYSDVHPIIVQLKKEDPLKAAYTAFDFDGKQLLPADLYYNLRHTVNPNLLLASIELGKKHGFIHLDKPEATDMKYKFIRQNHKGYLFAELISPSSPAERFNIFDPTGSLLTQQLFYNITDADKRQVKRFQKTPMPQADSLPLHAKKTHLMEIGLASTKRGKLSILQKRKDRNTRCENRRIADGSYCSHSRRNANGGTTYRRYYL